MTGKTKYQINILAFTVKDNRIAVIGMSFKYPHIDSMGELVKYLEAGEFVPADGWKERGALLHVPEYDKVSGLAPMMTGIEYFDSRFFKTVQKETLEMVLKIYFIF